MSATDEIYTRLRALTTPLLAVVATRVGLRTLPLIGRSVRSPSSRVPDSDVVMAIFRANSVTWAIGVGKHHSGISDCSRATALEVNARTSIDANAARALPASMATLRAYAGDDRESLSFDYAVRLRHDDPERGAANAAARVALRARERNHAMWDAIRNDDHSDAVLRDLDFARDIPPTVAAKKLIAEPLWLTPVPISTSSDWAKQKENLLRRNERWEAWILWYERRILVPEALGSLALEGFLLDLEPSFWRQAALSVNVEIEKHLEIDDQISRSYDRINGLRKNEQNTIRLYPPDGGGHGQRWRDQIKAFENEISELRRNKDSIIKLSNTRNKATSTTQIRTQVKKSPSKSRAASQQSPLTTDNNASIENFIQADQRPAAYRFTIKNEKIDVLFEELECQDHGLASDLHSELLRKAAELLNRLEKSNSAQRASDSVRRLIVVLGKHFEEVRPGSLLSVLRSIEADRLAC